MKKKDSLLLGAHMSIAGGFEKAIQRGESIGCTTIQIFTKSNRQWYAKPIKKTDALAFQEAQKNSLISSVIAHASYLINVGSPQKHIEEKSCKSLKEELERCNTLGINYLVIHPGAHLNDTQQNCLERIATNIDKTLELVPGPVSILLENTAGQGSNVGYTFEQLAFIRESVKNKSRVLFCFDTCHALAAGYDFRNPSSYADMWQEYDKIIGLKHLKAIHVNDSQRNLESRVDRHEHIGKGALGIEAFRLLFNDPRFFKIPKILETPKKDDLAGDKENMEVIKSLISKKTRQALGLE